MARRFETPRIDGRDAWHNIGGVEVVSARSLFIFSFASIGSYLIQNEARLGGGYSTWILLALATYVASILPMVVFRSQYLRLVESKPRPWLAIGLMALGGLLRGVTGLFFGNLFGLIPISDWLYRIAGGPIFVTGAMILVVLFMSSQGKHERALAELQLEKSRLDELRGGIRERINQQANELTKKVQASLAPAISSVYVQLKIKDQESRQQIVDNLMFAVEEVVRPLSKTLGTDQSSTGEAQTGPVTTAIRTRVALPALVSVGKMLLPAVSSIAITLLAVPTLQLSMPGLPGVVAALIVLVTIYLTLAVLQQLFRRVWASLWVAVVFTLVAALAATQVVWLAIHQVFSLPDDHPYHLQSAILISVVMLLGFGQQLARTRRFDSEQQLRRVIGDLEVYNSQLRQAAWLNRKRLATVLHGPVQAALYASAMRLAQAKSVSNELISGIEADLTTAMNKIESFGETENFDLVLSQIQDLWMGVCDVEYEISEQDRIRLRGAASAAICVLEVIREGVSNAVKHGDAKRAIVKLSTSSNPEMVEVTVSNDGKPMTDKTRSGYGAEILDEICFSWSLQSKGQWTELSAKVPV